MSTLIVWFRFKNAMRVVVCWKQTFFVRLSHIILLGWIAAWVAVVAFGSFGVPLKWVTTQVHPLVLQSYKTTMCFASCWIILLFGVPFQFSYYGILSGLFWVPGAACGIYGIRNAGLAIAVGTWSSITVLTSFLFGIIIFREGVHSLFYTILFFILLIFGLVGMAKFSQSSPPIKSPAISLPKPRPTSSRKPFTMTPVKRNPSFGKESQTQSETSLVPLLAPLEVERTEDSILDEYDKQRKDMILVFDRFEISQRQLGILGAVINGGWGGLNLIPLHYAIEADPNLKGAGYLISYATGSMMVNVGIWVIWYVYESIRTRSLQDAYESLPSFQFQTWGIPGCLAGIIYSIGNFSSIIAVAYLGQGTGFSVCMMQLFVSGLWGVFYFEEIRGAAIVPWFVSAAVAVFGIIGLSYQHEGESVHRFLSMVSS